MNPAVRDPGLEVAEDLAFQEISWTIQRAVFGLMALVILAALAGLLGDGPLSRTSVAGAGLRVRYERIERYRAPATLRVHPAPGATPDGLARLWLDRAWLDGVEVRRIVPEPERAEASGDRLVYAIRVAAGQPAAVTIHYEPDRFGFREGRVGLGDGGALSLRQWVHP